MPSIDSQGHALASSTVSGAYLACGSIAGHAPDLPTASTAAPNSEITEFSRVYPGQRPVLLSYVELDTARTVRDDFAIDFNTQISHYMLYVVINSKEYLGTVGVDKSR